MYKNRRIRAALGRTINLGNFESLRIDIEISADIADDVELENAQDDLFLQVEDELAARIEELTPKPSKPARGKISHE